MLLSFYTTGKMPNKPWYACILNCKYDGGDYVRVTYSFEGRLLKTRYPYNSNPRHLSYLKRDGSKYGYGITFGDLC